MRFRFPIIVSLVLLAAMVHASEFISTNEYTVAKNQSIAGEQWVMANTAKTDGTFKNDFFIFSNTKLLMNGIYEGNVWGAAGTDITLTGTCQRNVRTMGQTIRIDGTINGNLIAMASTISIGTNATITGNARLIAVQVIQEGTINGDLIISSPRSVTLSGTVKGNARVRSPEIILSDDAHIGGNLAYLADKELIPAENVVAGKLKRIPPENPYSWVRVQSHAMWFVAALLAGIPFIALFPMTTAMASLLARKSPLKCLLVGFAAMGVLPIFAMMSISSIIGLPLGALIFASWGILVYVSRIIMGLMIGTFLFRSNKSSVGGVLLSMATGLAIIYVLTFIPSTLGMAVQMLVIWTGMGSLLLALLQKRRLIIQVPEELKQIEALKHEQNKPTEESP